MKALIFGIGGFVGRYLTDELRSHGYEVAGSDIMDECSLHDVEYTKGDLLDPAFVDGLVDSTKPDAIINLAAIKLGCGKNRSAENGEPALFKSSRSTTRDLVCSSPSNWIEEITVPSEQALVSAKANSEKPAVTTHVKTILFRKSNTIMNIEKA